MKWSQQKKIHLSITTLLELKKINANHAKEGKIKKKKIQKRSINRSFQFLITKSKQCLPVNCFLN